MKKYSEIFSFMRKCPQMEKLWSIAATEEDGVNVVLPQGSSDAVQYDAGFDITGNFKCDIIPYPNVYEDYQINCYRLYDSNDQSAPESNINVIAIEEVQEIIEWINEKNSKGEFPKIGGKTVFAIECRPFVPQIRYVNPQNNTVAYFITVRIHYVNDISPRSVSIDM